MNTEITNENIENKSFCLKCKSKQIVKDNEIKITKNGKRYNQGRCSCCNTKCNRFLKTEKKPIEVLLDVKKEDVKEDVKEEVKLLDNVKLKKNKKNQTEVV